MRRKNCKRNILLQILTSALRLNWTQTITRKMVLVVTRVT